MKENQAPVVGRFRFIPHGKRAIVTPTSLRAPYGLEIIESCITCPHREDRLFCNLSPAAVQRLSTITHASSYPKGAILFLEGQTGRGVFILCSGRACGWSASVG